MVVVGHTGLIYTDMVEQFFTMSSIFTGNYTDRLESLHCAGYHITQIAYGCGDDIQRTGLI
jgi:hypothetical protein